MIMFTDPPTQDTDAPKVVRVKPGSPLNVTLLNVKYVGTDVHYWGGHTIACPRTQNCRACEEGLFPVWAGFIFAQHWGGGRIAMLAITAVVAANLLLHIGTTGCLAGMKVTLTRKTKAVNSGIFTEFHGYDLDADMQSSERLVKRVRILFKDYVISDSGPASS